MKILDASSVLDRILSRRYEMNITIAILIIGTAGSFLQIGGTSWDITSHIMQEPETFFTPSHTGTLHGCWIANNSCRIKWSFVIKK